jgi:hypothetical protein
MKPSFLLHIRMQGWLKPGAFKRYGSTAFNVYSPTTLAAYDTYDDARENSADRAVVIRVAFESKRSSRVFFPLHSLGSRVETRRFQAVGRLDSSTCTAPTTWTADCANRRALATPTSPPHPPPSPSPSPQPSPQKHLERPPSCLQSHRGQPPRPDTLW